MRFRTDDQHTSNNTWHHHPCRLAWFECSYGTGRRSHHNSTTYSKHVHTCHIPRRNAGG